MIVRSYSVVLITLHKCVNCVYLICVYIRNAFEYIYTSTHHFLKELAVFGTHISLKRIFDVIYLDTCLPVYFFRGK